LNKHFSKEDIQIANEHIRCSNITHHQGNANQNTTRYHLTPIRMAIIKNPENSKCWQGCGEMGTLLRCWWKCQIEQPLWKTVWQFPEKLNIELAYNPTILLLGICPKELKAGSQRDICIPMFIAALFTIAKRWKQLKRPSTEDQINTMLYIHTMEYYSALKKEGHSF